MRRIRALTLAAAVVAVLPATVVAQNGRTFDDSWFWGIKLGGFTFADSGRKYVQAPSLGVEWMITRSKGGLYVSGSETFFTQHSFVLGDVANGDTSVHAVRLKNLRKLDVALIGFPGDHLRFHPYVGIGFTMSQVASAQPEGTFATADQLNFTEQVIQDRRVAFSPVLIGGAQYRMRKFSVFGQATISPAQRNFILYNLRPFTFGYEVGLRYNFGSAIDRN